MIQPENKKLGSLCAFMSVWREEDQSKGGRRVGGRKDPEIFKHPASLVQNVIKC